jgi:hypothetical protein
VTVRGRERIADWIEIALLIRGDRPIGLDPLYESQRVSIGLHEMQRRSDLLGGRYPFKIYGEYAVKAEALAEQTTYAAMVLTSAGNPVREYLGSAPDETMALIFETIVVDAVRHLWGPEGQALRFGWPSDIGRPPEFDLAIRWLADRVGVPVGRGYRQPRRKDGGVDVIGWRSFADRRSGFPLLLVQCTLQENLLAKGMDIDTRLWGSWLTLDVDPTTALATSSALAPGPVWDELALKYMILDRVRLAGLAERQIVDEVALGWVRQTIADLDAEMEEIKDL